MTRVYEFTATSLDYGQLLIRYEYSEADPSVGLDETYDWFAFEENTNKDVTYELDRDEQKYIFRQVKQHYKEVCKTLANDVAQPCKPRCQPPSGLAYGCAWASLPMVSGTCRLPA